jgi:hypothetical protein
MPATFPATSEAMLASGLANRSIGEATMCDDRRVSRLRERVRSLGLVIEPVWVPVDGQEDGQTVEVLSGYSLQSVKTKKYLIGPDGGIAIQLGVLETALSDKLPSER